MTYLIVMVPFLVLALAVFALAAVRAGIRPMLIRCGVTAGVLVLLTLVFDNVMIAAGLFDYPAGSITEVRIGLMPVEDLSYPLVAALLLPSLSALLAPRSRAETAS